MTSLRVGTLIGIALVSVTAAGCDLNGSDMNYKRYPVSPPHGTYRSLDSAIQHPDSVLYLELQYGRTYDSIPSQVSLFKNMLALRMCGNRITDMPAFLSKTNIEELWLKNNYIDSIRVASIPSTLEHLYLDSNRISSLPVEIVRLGRIKGLVLNHNNIRTISPDIRLIADSLRGLYLSDNPLAPRIIDSLNKWLPKTFIIFP